MKKNYSSRALALRLSSDGVPATLNEEARSVQVTMATEERVQVYDWNRGVVDEVLLMSGCRIPESGQVVLLDSHSRYSTSSVIGSCRAMRVDGGQLVGTAMFSSVRDAEGQWTKVREGHLTDFSIGYRIGAKGAVWVEAGETAVIEGRSFVGPVRVVTDWSVKELSVCPIGADDQAKARAESEPHNHNDREDELMDKRMRAFLERQGLPKDATEEDAWRFLEELNSRSGQQQGQQQQPQQAQGPSEDEIRTMAERAERERSVEITAMGRRFGMDELADSLIKDGVAIDEARKRFLDQVAKDAESGIGFRGPVSLGTDERDKFRSAAIDAIMLRGGIGPEKPAAGADELAGRSLVELARMALIRANQSDAGRPLDVVGRALTVSDFPSILAASANKSLIDGFDTAEETWSTWAATGSVSDFKAHTAVRASETADLDEIPDGTEYKYSDRDETKETYQIATYGKLYALTRQTIINDDLGALTDVPRAHGESAARKIGDVVYAVLTANSAMGDGVALFHASSHGNLASSGAAPGITTLAAAIKAMKIQKDLKSKRRLNIRPQYFLAPVALEGAAEVFFRSEKFADSDTVATDSSLAATRANPYSGTYFTRVYDPRLDDSDAAAWYLAAARGKTVKVFFLDGMMVPFMETKSGWNVDGVEYKVRIDAGAKAMDYRGLYKNPGD